MPRCPKCEKLMDASETKCPFCGQPVAWEKKKVSKEIETTGPVGRGGWLVPVAVYFFVSLPLTGYFFWGYFVSGYRLIPALCGLYVMYDLILIGMYFSRHRYFRTTGLFVQGLHIASIAAVTADSMRADPATSGDSLTLGISIMIVIALVGIYLFKSKRVRNTYRDTGAKS